MTVDKDGSIISHFFALFAPCDDLGTSDPSVGTSDEKSNTERQGNGDDLQFLAAKFISGQCIRDGSQFVDADLLRDALSKESGSAVNSRQLGRVLKSLGIMRVRRRRKYQRYYTYHGLTFKPDSPYAPKEMIRTENGDTRKTSVSTRNEKNDSERPGNGDTYNLSVDAYTPSIKTEVRKCVVCNRGLSTTNQSNWCIGCRNLFFSGTQEAEN